MPWRDPHAPPADRVTPVETFFDVVFAFSLTQLTRALEADLSLAGVARVLLVFGVLWWMYGGYVWLTNHVPPRRPSQKLLLFAGMAGFLVTAVGVPHAFDGTGVLFGLGYLVVICIHLILFSQSDAIAGVLRIVPFNIGAALLVLLAGFVDGPAVYVLWVAGFVFMAVVPYLVPRYSWVSVAESFHVSAAHFVERHGLLVIVALGESVIAIGMGVDVEHVTALTVGSIVLALALPGTLWWTYFSDAYAAERVLGAAEVRSRTFVSLRVYFFAHIPLLLGIVVSAAGIHPAIAHPGAPATWQSATALSGGIALFLFGIADVRRCLGIGSIRSRLIAATVVLATIPIAVTTSAGLQLASVVAVVTTMLVIERRDHVTPPHPG